METLKARARFNQAIRDFFTSRHFLEVEVPIMGQYGVSDCYLANIKAEFRHKTFFLQTSPEYHLKRLLAAEYGSIFSLARVFRDDELGKWHNPEFSLLEWYQLECDHHQLMDEMSQFLTHVFKLPPLKKISYQSLFLETCGIDPFDTTLETFKKVLVRYDLKQILDPNESDKDQYLFLLMTHVVEPFLRQYAMPIAVYDFPPSQASLARIVDNKACRFEVYYQGIELANGFYELTHYKEQVARFESDNQLRQVKGLPQMDLDHYFLAALQQGLPSCSGVALGLDRLYALLLNLSCIQEVLAFDFSRA